MKLTAGEVYNAMEALKGLTKEKLPIKGAYWVNRIIRKLEPEYATIEEQRNELIKKYGEEADGKVQVMNGNLSAFLVDFNAVLASEIEVDCPKIKLDLLGDGAVDGGALIPLDKFIEE